MYQIPLAFSTSADADEQTSNHPQSILATLATPIGPGVLHDAATREDFRQRFLSLIERNATISLSIIKTAVELLPQDASRSQDVLARVRSESSEDELAPPNVKPTSGVLVAPAPLTAQPGEAATPPRADGSLTLPENRQQLQPRESPYAGEPVEGRGRLEAHASSAFAHAHAQQLPSRIGSAEQSNTSILYGKQFILKLFRRLQPGENPDVEIGRFLTEVASFPRIAPFLGEVALNHPNGDKTTIAMLQGLVTNDGDGWQWFLDQLADFMNSVATLPVPPAAAKPSFLSDQSPLREALEHSGASLQAAAMLGRRSAEMHLALATPTNDSAFAAEPFTADDLARDAQRIDAQITSTLEALKLKLSALKDLTADDAALLLSRRIDLFARANAITGATAGGQRIRIHGDCHLGQTLRTGGAAADDAGDFVLLDFEGEPARLLAERRQKQSPLKDVAGMIRSLSYAAYSGLYDYFASHPELARRPQSESLTAWAVLWQNSVSSEFLRAYRETIAVNPQLLPAPQQAQALLSAYLLEKALYELLYELNNRPSWLRIPLAGILAL